MYIKQTHRSLRKSIIFIGILFATFGITSQANAACEYDGTNFHIKDKPAEITTAIYRLYNTKTGVHLYTRGAAASNSIMRKWSEFEYTDATPAFCMSLTKKDGLTPIYRLYNTKTGVHLYARGAAARDNIKKKWPEFQYTDGKPAFWADITNDAGPPLISHTGPLITVGLHAYSRDALRDSAFKIDANKTYVIKDKDGKRIATVPGSTTTRVKYNGDSNLRIYDSIAEKIVNREIRFEAADGNDSDMIFNIHKPGSEYDEYRGRVKLLHSKTTRNTWVINELPLELYIWGIGEITGTGDDDYDRLMTTAFRTYAYWKILYSTKYALEGFTVDATPGNQIYRGYEWEKRYPDIKKAAQITRGKVAKHKSDVALSPFSSWTDGRTRSFEERWSSTLYPWCQSVKDSWGKHPNKSTDQLVAEGNHMVGISAHGALSLAGDHGWDWDKILKYYLTNVNIAQIY